MSFFLNTNLSQLVNASHDSLIQPNPPPNTPDQFQRELPSYAQAIGITTEQQVNTLNEIDFSCFASYLGIREEQNNEIFYDPTEPHPIFPFVRNRTHHVSLHHFPHFADQSPLGFSKEEWERVWKATEINLDTYLRYTRVGQDDTLVPWTNEYDYHGVNHRLTIDHNGSLDGLPKFMHGTSIVFRNCNGRNFRYVVDHCVKQDDMYAYLKIICFDSSQRRYTICSYRPPLILIIPKRLCKVRLHPNLIPNRTRAPQRFYTRMEQEIIDEVLHGYHGNRSRSFWRRLFCR